MTPANNPLLKVDFESSMDSHENKSPLRFITCGSADDGKSTLIDLLLQESEVLSKDQLNSDLGANSYVAYQCFASEHRQFIVADIPGQEEFTRNLITGASTADAAVILVDVTQGMTSQTRRHSYLISLLGITNVILAVNKMDLVNYDEATYNQTVESYREIAEKIALENFTAIPMSALKGDNVFAPSATMPWYHGTTLMSYLETVHVNSEVMQELPFRLPVESADRQSSDSHSFTGAIASGIVYPGDEIRVQPSGKTSSIASIASDNEDLEYAVAGQSVTVTLADNIDLSPGDMISTTLEPASSANQFESTIVWMHEEDMLPGRPYLLNINGQSVTATVTDIKFETNVDTLEHVAAKSLKQNSIGVCNISTDAQIAFDAYAENRETGGLSIIDSVTRETVGAGLLHFALRRSDNIHMQAVDVDKSIRSELKDQKACVLWFTGLSGAGKSTVANIVEKKLAALGKHTYLLDGDNVRHGLNKDLGFTDADRVENIRRIGEVAGLMVDSGLIVLTAFISPFRSERLMARNLVSDDEFLEVFVDTPLALAEERDPKGLYKKARRGDLKNFTGIDSPYEPPENAEIQLDTSTMSAEQAADQVISDLRKKGIIKN